MILAVDSANRLGAGEIEPRHLLLALMRDSSNGIADLLGEKGVTVSWLREKLTEIYTQDILKLQDLIQHDLSAWLD